MNIIWLMKLTLIALTVSTSLSFAHHLVPGAPVSKIQKGLIVVIDPSPMVLVEK